MTEAEYNQAANQGKVEYVQPNPVIPDPEPTDFDAKQYEGLLESLRKPRTYLADVPTFEPKTFADSIQYVDNGVTKSAYAYINGEWVQLGGGSVAGDDQEIQFNDNGDFGADPNFKWDGDNQVLRLPEIKGFDAEVGSDDDGEEVVVGGGDADGNGFGGDMTVTSGRGGATGPGGEINIIPGQSGSNSDGRDLNLVSSAGQGSSSVSGDVGLFPALGANGANPGRIKYSRGFGVSADSYTIMLRTTTNNATPATIRICTIPTSQPVLFEAHIVGSRTGGSAGSAGDAATYVRRASYKRIGSGAPSLMGSVEDVFTQEDQAGWDATLVISSNDIQLQVTGAADNDITWQAKVFFISSQSVPA